MEISLDELVETLEKHKVYLTDDHIQRLRLVVTGGLSSSDGSIMSELISEVQQQLDHVRKFRDRIQRMGDQASTRELKDMTQATSSLFTMLTKLNEEITNQDRLRKIENATIDAIKTLEPSVQNRFFAYLEAALRA